MALSEGFRRITVRGKIVGTTGAVFIFLAMAFQILQYRFAMFPGAAGLFFIAGVYLLVMGATVLAIGWIGEGFS
jgi:hypothetical protein